jgi:hypothetical protein
MLYNLCVISPQNAKYVIIFSFFCLNNIYIVHESSSLVFGLLGRIWQEPEPSQVTGMALARCILGKFLGVVCHCFPLPLDVPTFAARCMNNVQKFECPTWPTNSQGVTSRFVFQVEKVVH